MGSSGQEAADIIRPGDLTGRHVREGEGGWNLVLTVVTESDERVVWSVLYEDGTIDLWLVFGDDVPESIAQKKPPFDALEVI